MIKESIRYRDVERIEIQNQHDEHFPAIVEWNNEITKKLKDGDESISINMADQGWIQTNENILENWTDIEKIMKNCEEESTLFTDRLIDIFGRTTIAFQAYCTDIIDLSVDSVTHDSENLIEEMKGVQKSLFNSFENCTKLFLEKRRARHCIAHGLPHYSNGPSCMTELAEEMEEKLDSLRCALDTIVMEISGTLLNCPETDTVVVACKQFERDSIGSHEIKNLLDLSSRNFFRDQSGRHNVIRCLGQGIAGDHRILLMELCPRSLADIINTRRKEGKFLDKDDFTRWGDELASGMNFLHDAGIYHGDLKPNNILISGSNEVKIADFGLSVKVENVDKIGKNISFNRGTPRYMAPEQHSDRLMTLIDVRRCDVWSFGVCLWEMITCRPPFSDLPDASLPLRIG
ncbi:hypothetical protein PMAYCL1PPCAC_19203, partial [Pristionchus mayeri]